MEQRETVFYRILATGACFALFGLGGLILGLLVLPVLLVLPGGAERRRARMRGLVQLAFRLFVEIMNGLRAISYEIHGRERLGRPGQLIIANHPTLIDVVLIVAFTPAPTCVVKAALFRNPFMRRVLRAAGYIPNQPDRHDDRAGGGGPARRGVPRDVPGGHSHAPRRTARFPPRRGQRRRTRRAGADAGLCPL